MVYKEQPTKLNYKWFTAFSHPIPIYRLSSITVGVTNKARLLNTPKTDHTDQTWIYQDQATITSMNSNPEFIASVAYPKPEKFH